MEWRGHGGGAAAREAEGEKNPLGMDEGFDAAGGGVEGIGLEHGCDGQEEGGGLGREAVSVEVGEGDAEVFLGTGESHIEAAGVFAEALLVGALEVVAEGVGAFDGVEDDDAFEFEALGFVGGGDEEALAHELEHTFAVAQVGLAEGVDFDEIAVELLAKGGGKVGVDDVDGEVVDDMLPFGHGLDYPLGQEADVEVLQFVDEGGELRIGGRLGKEALLAVEEEGAVDLAETQGHGADGGLGEKLALAREEGGCLLAAIGKEGEGGPDVVDGVVGVGALEVEGLEEALELVDPQAWLDEADEFEGVETLAVAEIEAKGAADVLVEDVEVELDVVADEDMTGTVF